MPRCALTRPNPSSSPPAAQCRGRSLAAGTAVGASTSLPRPLDGARAALASSPVALFRGRSLAAEKAAGASFCSRVYPRALEPRPHNGARAALASASSSRCNKSNAVALEPPGGDRLSSPTPAAAHIRSSGRASPFAEAAACESVWRDVVALHADPAPLFEAVWRDVVAQRAAPISSGSFPRPRRGESGTRFRPKRRRSRPPSLAVTEPVRLSAPVRVARRPPTPVPLSAAAAEAANHLGLAKAQWIPVRPGEYRCVLPNCVSGASKAAFAPLPGVVSDLLAFAASADPVSAKRRLRRAIASAPLCLDVQLYGPRACTAPGVPKASAWDANSIATACPWPYRRTHRRRAVADFRPDVWQAWHRRVCAHCRHRPAGTLQLDTGDVVTVDPACAMFGMSMRLWCGLELPLSSPVPRRVFPNHGSARRFADAVDAQIQEQLQLGFLQEAQPEQLHSTVPLLAVVRPSDARRAAQSGSQPKVRVCSDFSLAGLNRRCPAWSFAFPRVREVLARIGPGWAGGVADVSAFYRRLPWDESDTKYFGISWRGKLYRDRVLTFGSNITPAAAQTVSSSIAEFVVYRAVTELRANPTDILVVPYLDDVLFVARSLRLARRLEALVIDTFEKCGLPLPQRKRQHSSTSWVWIGWRFDTVARTLSVTPGKREELTSRVGTLIRSADVGEPVSTAELRSLVCALSHYRLALPGSPARLSALFRVLAVSRRGRRGRVQLDRCASALRDLRWFASAIIATSGVSVWRDWEREAVVICTDASGEPGPQSGFGAIMFDGSSISMWQRAWSAAELAALADGHDSSTLRELTAVFAAAEHWRQSLQGRPVLFLLDSAAAACIINRGSAAFAPSAASTHSVSLQLSDLMLSTQSVCMAWWLRRDTATIQAADHLSRSNVRPTPDSQSAFLRRRSDCSRCHPCHPARSCSRRRRLRRQRA